MQSVKSDILTRNHGRLLGDVGVYSGGDLGFRDGNAYRDSADGHPWIHRDGDALGIGIRIQNRSGFQGNILADHHVRTVTNVGRYRGIRMRCRVCTGAGGEETTGQSKRVRFRIVIRLRLNGQVPRVADRTIHMRLRWYRWQKPRPN